jgi:hypothetical protein
MWEEFEETKKYAFNLRNNTMHQSFMRDFPNNVYLLLPLIHFETWQRRGIIFSNEFPCIMHKKLPQMPNRR